MEEVWLARAAEDMEVVVLRPARVIGPGEEWMIPRLIRRLVDGRIWLAGGGRVTQTFIAASDVGRACLAAAERGKPGRKYLLAGFDSTWREFLELAAHSLDVPCRVVSLPYDLAFLRGLGVDMVTPSGAVVWPGVYAVDAIAKPHLYDDSQTHRRRPREVAAGPPIGRAHARTSLTDPTHNSSSSFEKKNMPTASTMNRT